MKNIMNKLGVVIMVAVFGLFSFMNAQTLSGASAKVTVSGTSTLHPWTMTANKAAFTGTLSGNILKDIKFQMAAKNLKSGKGPMDTNAYKALKADKFPQITFTAKQMTVGKGSVTGLLTVAGKSKTVTVPVTAEKKGTTYHINGSTKMKMSEFGVVSPSFMMNTVKTGDDITISFNIVAK